MFLKNSDKISKTTIYQFFQINDKNYCGKGKIGGKCKIRCEGKFLLLFCLKKYAKFFDMFLVNLQFYSIFFYFSSIELLSDDITKAAQCAQIVLNTEGFKAWKGWEVRCKPNIGHLPPYNECFKPTAVAG